MPPKIEQAFASPALTKIMMMIVSAVLLGVGGAVTHLTITVNVQTEILNTMKIQIAALAIDGRQHTQTAADMALLAHRIAQLEADVQRMEAESRTVSRPPL